MCRWGGADGLVYQKAYVEFFTNPVCHSKCKPSRKRSTSVTVQQCCAAVQCSAVQSAALALSDRTLRNCVFIPKGHGRVGSGRVGAQVGLARLLDILPQSCEYSYMAMNVRGEVRPSPCSAQPVDDPHERRRCTVALPGMEANRETMCSMQNLKQACALCRCFPT